MAKKYQIFFIIFNILLVTVIFCVYIKSLTSGSYAVLSIQTEDQSMSNKFAKMLVKNNSTGNESTPSLVRPELNEYADFDAALRDTVVDDVIVMAVISINVVEMAMNFYVSSVVKFNITNLIFIAIDHEACDYVIARRRDVDFRCHVLSDDGKRVSVTKFDMYGIFAQRTMAKPLAAYAILERGYDVLLTDIDIVYLKNPLPYIRRLCLESDCDMAIQKDVKAYNPGFLYARPTSSTMAVLNRTLEWHKNTSAMEMVCFRKALEELRSFLDLRIVNLDGSEFPCGKYAFPAGLCPSKSYLDKVYIIHGNWLVFHEDKIHRFKDCLLWEYDGEDGYYSNPKRRYVMYSDHVTSEYMTPAYLNLFAIAQILNRTSILPKVIREGRPDIVNSWRILKGKRTFRDGDFDKATGNNYRFGNFLRHHLVPDDVKSSLSPVYCINPDCLHDNETKILTPRDPDHGPTLHELLGWFGTEKCSVLRLKALIKEFKNLDYVNILGRDLYNSLVYRQINP